MIEASFELRRISELKCNTLYLLPHSQKQELAQRRNSQADFGQLALPTGSGGHDLVSAVLGVMGKEKN